MTLNPDGTFTYTANPGFWGQDFFHYRATDGQHESLTATVYVFVQPTCSCFDARTLNDRFAVAAPADTDLQTLERLHPARNQNVNATAVIVTQLEFAVTFMLYSDGGGTIPVVQDNTISVLDPSTSDPVTEITDFIGKINSDQLYSWIDKAAQAAKMYSVVLGSQGIWQLIGAISIRPSGNVYKVVERSPWWSWWYGESTKCWELYKPYTRLGLNDERKGYVDLTSHIKLIQHPIFINPTDKNTWEELIQNTLEFYREFKDKITRERPNPKARAWEIARRDNPNAIVVMLRQKPL